MKVIKVKFTEKNLTGNVGLVYFGRFTWDKFRLFSHRNRHELSEAEDKIRWKIWKKKWSGRVTSESDSSVKGVFGSQEGAEKGCNPVKKGQKSYHPIFCFIAEKQKNHFIARER
ncbi:hypothetical protein QUF90_09805 [Desulfococcaceae bacterium HSG9]|nr:hypothetical protein [Desulfococcaceae bacterium HSG9]